MEDGQAVIKEEVTDDVAGGSSYEQDGLSSDKSVLIQSVDNFDSKSCKFGANEATNNKYVALDEHGLYSSTVEPYRLNLVGQTAVGMGSIVMEGFKADIKIEPSEDVCNGSPYEQNKVAVKATINLEAPDGVGNDVPGEFFSDKCTLVVDINTELGDCDMPSISHSVDICENGHKNFRSESKACDIDQHVHQCDICGKQFDQPLDLQSHVVSTHIGEKRFTCDICGKSLSCRSYLRKHILTHSDEKPYKCDICGKSFSLSSYLRKHILTHSGEKPYRCDICGYCSIRATDLRKHLQTHTGEKPYKCDICGQCYSTNKNLKTHFRTHTGEKPFKCDICGKRFSTNEERKRHLRTHTGERPYKCDNCGKNFRRAHHLKKHIRTHIGEMLYKCYICEETFDRYEALKCHIPTHTAL